MYSNKRIGMLTYGMRHALLVSLIAIAMFVVIPSLQSQSVQAGSWAAADEQATREIAENINKRHDPHARSDKSAYSAFLDRSAVFASPGEVLSGAQQIAE